MKVKRLKIGVRPLQEGLDEFGATLKALQRGQSVKKRTGVYFVSVRAMRSVLTEPRLTLLHLIRAHRPHSIAELAKLARRDFKNVYHDLKMLADLGLVHLEQGSKLRDQVIPTVTYTRIQFEIAV
jgi:predicted transcriptional regulator